MTIKTNAILKQNGKFFNVYLMNVPVYFAVVHQPKEKYQSTGTEYAITAFVDQETRDKLESEFKLNKELFEVGRDKNKKKEVKYKTSKQLKDGEKYHYDAVLGLHGIALSVDTVDKNGYAHKVTVVDKEGKPFTADIGNESICNIKLFAYKNREDMLIVVLDTVQVIDHVPFEGGSKSSGGMVTDEVLGVSYTLEPTEKVGDSSNPAQNAQGEEKSQEQGKGISNAPQASQDAFDDFDPDVPF